MFLICLPWRALSTTVSPVRWTTRAGIRRAIALMVVMGSQQVSSGAAPMDVLYIRAQFEDVPMTIAGVPNSSVNRRWVENLRAMDSLAEDFWSYNSYGQISEFQSGITEVYTLPDSTSSQFQSGANVFGISHAMREMARESGWEVERYDQIVLSFPGLPAFPAGALGTPGTIWMPGGDPFKPGFVHEFGHALGVGHASAIEGDGVVLPGDHREGRDGLVMMGSEDGRLAPINLPMRHVMGFVDPRLVRRATQAGVFRIHSFDRESIVGDEELERLLGVRVSHQSRDYWLSFAPGLADIWADFNGEGWASGVVVQQLSGDITRILDFTPGSQGGNGNEEDYVDTRDGALVVGDAFTFPNSELTLKPLQTGTSDDGVKWIDVRIAFSGTDFLDGDYNDDGVISLADYVVWRDSLGSSEVLPNDLTPGTVGADDYVVWRSQFQGGATGLGESVSVAEPSVGASASMLVVTLLIAKFSQRTRYGCEHQITAAMEPAIREARSDSDN